ncbi:MAG TPA: TIM barrel protein [Anaerolineales bacterium]|nr:TIM barrel protein [Anaerolineales bacterium]
MFRIANAPCSWGVIEGIDGERGGYVRVIDEMQETGYAGTELGDWGFMPTDPASLTRELDSRQLSLLASWVSVFLQDASRHQQSADDAVRTAKLLAAVGGRENMIVLGNDPYGDVVRTKHAGRITADLGMSQEQWQIFATGANYVARRVMDEAGLRTVFHHHIGTWVETPEETRRLMDMTDPTILGLCFDTGHWAFAGGDPVHGIHEFGDRIWHVHFKDHEPNVARQSREQGWDGPTAVGQGVFCELGRGDVDFPGVVKALRDIGYAGWIVVEQDVLPGMGTPKESAQRNREYLKSIGL